MIELFINNQLCDISTNFSVRLNRKLIDPTQLNTKDAQYSYRITIPATGRNNRIFNYSHIEETVGKFNQDYQAEINVNGVRIFKGLFRLYSISATAYSGNLYVPVLKGISDIFGEIKLNQNPEYRIGFDDFAASINRYNASAKNGPQMAIFPYALYGVLPKVPAVNGSYTARNLWDDTVRIGIQDFPPSINPLMILRHIFTSNGYKIQGSAFNDERLKRVYMSYKNDPEYVQPWNYGHHAKMNISASWNNVKSNWTVFEENGLMSSDEKAVYYLSDLLNASNVVINSYSDPGGNMLIRQSQGPAKVWQNIQMSIPATGYYKVRLLASIQIDTEENRRDGDRVTGLQFVSGNASNDSDANSFSKKRYDVKVLRDRRTGDFGIANGKVDKEYYRNNINQVNIWGPDDDGREQYIPKYFPEPTGISGGRINETLFVDPAQNPNLIAGLSWGCRIHNRDTYNPRIGDEHANRSAIHGAVLAAKTGLSWDNAATPSEPTKLAIPSAGYVRYGYLNIDDEGQPEPDPGEDVGDVVGWSPSGKFKIDINNAPQNYARRNDIWNGDGEVSVIVWLEAGELITVVSASDEGRYKRQGSSGKYGWTKHAVDFELDIQPFRVDEDWLKVNTAGNGTDTMNWNDPVNFDTESINLVGFLPADMKTDDFIDNFCKVFNLRLSQINADTFELNIMQRKTATSNRYINLDSIASVKSRVNTPLGLPSLYKLGFTVDQEEEGYVVTGDDGGGEYATGVTEEKIIEQKSTFSYNWFKDITKTERGGNIILPIPVISKTDVWQEDMNPNEAIGKSYTNQALRFWFYDGLLNDLGATFQFNGAPLLVAKVSNELPGLLTLNYKNEKLTILGTYFTVLVNGSSHYTEIEGYLTPVQYEAFNGEVKAMFNGSLYYVAEIQGYDPSGRNKTKIKLIRNI